MKEVAVVIGYEGKDLFWISGLSSVAIPDSQDLWQAIWENRDKVNIVAHTHPGKGHYPRPSSTDLSTFRAIEAALGRCLWWWILNEDHCIILRRWEDEEPGDYDLVEFEEDDMATMIGDNAEWVKRLRELSYGGENNG